MQNERRQKQKAAYCVILLHDILEKKQNYRHRNLIGPCQKLKLGIGDGLPLGVREFGKEVTIKRQNFTTDKS